MFEIEVELSFSAAHYLRGYKGKCETLHGHNWKVKASVNSAGLDELGMVMDFGKLKQNLKAVLDELDHRNLSEIGYFKKINPTSENIAKFIFDKLSNTQQVTSNKQQARSNTLKKVTVWETETSSATYTPQKG